MIVDELRQQKKKQIKKQIPYMLQKRYREEIVLVDHWFNEHSFLMITNAEPSRLASTNVPSLQAWTVLRD
jgi:hypothetical protein